MKIALITDTHFGARNDHSHFNDYFYDFYDNQFFPYLKEHNIKTCIHLGDVMDRRKFVSYKIAQDFRKKFVQPFADQEIDLHMMVGNHDTFYKNTNDVNSLDELIGERYKNVTIYSECQTVEFDGLPIFFIPWINNTNTQHTFNEIEKTKAIIAMGHLEVKGFEMHHGIKSETGWEKNKFQKFDTVYTGHFHKKSDDGHIFYLGTPYQIFWNDDNCPKGFHIFDTETLETERIINPRRIFQKIYYDDSVKDFSKESVLTSENKYVKLIIVNKKDLYNFDRYVDRLLTESKAHDIKIIEDFTELKAENISDAITENTQDTMSILEKYVDDLDVQNLNRNRLKSMLKGLYIEASNMEI